jgi:hypothetical protein
VTVIFSRKTVLHGVRKVLNKYSSYSLTIMFEWSILDSSKGEPLGWKPIQSITAAKRLILINLKDSCKRPIMTGVFCHMTYNLC